MAAILPGLLAPALIGCGSYAGQSLVIATPWAEAETRALAKAFAGRPGDPVSITWVRLSPGLGPEDVLAHRAPVDLFLGGPASDYRRLAASGKLGNDDGSSWRVARRSPTNRGASDDPREDPARLAGAIAELHAGRWPEGYASLIRSAPEGEGEWIEGAALAPGADNPEAARAFLGLLKFPETPTPAAEPPEADPLLADLLGAVLIDARDELQAARTAVRRADDPPRWVAWMTQPPPWPPASLTRLVERHRAKVEALEARINQQKAAGEDVTSLRQELARLIPPDRDLARQFAPDEASRAWLLESWARAPRPIDGALLAEIAGAADGRLVREPRFRAWLRGEWRAWARQRFRRVAREAGKGRP